MLDSYRPKTAPEKGEGKATFTLSSRPSTAIPPEEPVRLAQSPLSMKETLRKAKQEMMDEQMGDQPAKTIMPLVFHISDQTVTTIVDNPKVIMQSLFYRVWGNADDLQRTADFVAASTLQV
jgi:hypothetical protein